MTTKNKHTRTTNQSGRSRKNEKYPSLKKEFNLPRYQEQIDFDYLHKLNNDELKWLNDFMSEYLGGDFRNRGKDNALHNTPELRRECYNYANRVNRDIYNRQRHDILYPNQQQSPVDSEESMAFNETYDIEDAIIDKIDSEPPKPSIKKTKTSTNKRVLFGMTFTTKSTN